MADFADTPRSTHVIIRGLTSQGRAFRPSDWSERLAGVMAQFRPDGAARGGAGGRPLSYSPWCVPRTVDGVKCVIVSRELAQHERMAWDFVMGFARDNDLQVMDGNADGRAAGAEGAPGQTG